MIKSKELNVFKRYEATRNVGKLCVSTMIDWLSKSCTRMYQKMERDEALGFDVPCVPKIVFSVRGSINCVRYKLESTIISHFKAEIAIRSGDFYENKCSCNKCRNIVCVKSD